MKIEDRIIKSCTELAQTRGLRNFTMDELAARAGVSKRTVYRYYRSKEEIVEAVLDNFMTNAAAEGDRIMALELSPINLINQILNYLFINARFIVSEPGLNDLRQYYPHLWKKIEQFRSERIAILIQLITRERQGLVNDIDPRIISAVTMASIQAVLNPDFILENGLSFQETAKQLIRFLMSAVVIEQK
ncbi:MAG: TetR/AcrR family transcriptional regulator [Syntrophomonadaceae bacterium]|nr:TetR/AcrR family transcriptional regulator [Syntrophomonadaceae bacterium]